MCYVQKVFPRLLPQLTAQACLHFLPGRQSALELGFTAFGQAQPPFSPVLAAAFCDPTLPVHDLESAGESRSVHSEYFAQLALSNFSSQRERLQDGELGGPQSQRAQRIFIKLGQCPRSAAKAAAHAREFRYRGAFHGMVDVYTCNRMQEIFRVAHLSSCSAEFFQKKPPRLSISPCLVRHTSRGKTKGSSIQEADMARPYGPPERLRSIAGGALIGLGLHILFGNLDRGVVQVRHLLGTTAGDALGTLPTAVLAASQAVQAYALDHQAFLLGLGRLLISFWPLLLVMAGTVLLQDALTDKVKASPAPADYFQNAIFRNKDAGCRFRCPSFDA